MSGQALLVTKIAPHPITCTSGDIKSGKALGACRAWFTKAETLHELKHAYIWPKRLYPFILGSVHLRGRRPELTHGLIRLSDAVLGHQLEDASLVVVEHRLCSRIAPYPYRSLRCSSAQSYPQQC